VGAEADCPNVNKVNLNRLHMCSLERVLKEPGVHLGFHRLGSHPLQGVCGGLTTTGLLNAHHIADL
jgi:hypothetical protein